MYSTHPGVQSSSSQHNYTLAMKHLLSHSTPKIYFWVFKCIFSLNGSCLKILFLLKCPTIDITLFRTTRCDVRDTAQGTSKTALCRKCITGVLLKGLVRVIAVKCTTNFLWGLLQTVDIAGLVSFTGRKPWTWHSLLKVYWFIHALSW